MSTTSPMVIEGFFDPQTSTISYLLLDARTGDCALIDSVLDDDPTPHAKTAAAARKQAAVVAHNVLASLGKARGEASYDGCVNA